MSYEFGNWASHASYRFLMQPIIRSRFSASLLRSLFSPFHKSRSDFVVKFLDLAISTASKVALPYGAINLINDTL